MLYGVLCALCLCAPWAYVCLCGLFVNSCVVLSGLLRVACFCVCACFCLNACVLFVMYCVVSYGFSFVCRCSCLCLFGLTCCRVLFEIYYVMVCGFRFLFLCFRLCVVSQTNLFGGMYH